MAVEVLAAIFAVIAIAIILRISLAARTPTALRLSLPQEIKPEGQVGTKNFHRHDSGGDHNHNSIDRSLTAAATFGSFTLMALWFLQLRLVF